MRVRMIVECDGGELSRILTALPPTAQWHATRAPKQSPATPMRQMVMDEISPPKPKKITKYKPRGDGRNIELITNLVRAHPDITWAEIIRAGGAAGFVRSNISSMLVKLVASGRIIKENKKYRIGEST